MILFIETFIKWVIPAICGLLLGVIAGMMKKLKRHEEERKKEYTAMKDGLLCLLRHDIVRFCTNALDDGYISVSYREALSRSYKAYRTLGGNDVVTELYNRVMELRIK